MHTLLIVIAVCSILLALGLAALLWQVLGRERARSDARVALLMAAAEACDGDLPDPGAGRGPSRDTAQVIVPPATQPHPVADLFGMDQTATPRVGVTVLAGAALSATIAVMVALQLAGPAPAAHQAEVSDHRPLELLTLEHEAGAGGLTIAGIARNPREGSRRTGVLAVAVALDAEGREIGSSRAAVERVELEPGSESPFVIKVPVSEAVSRYRVGFHSAEGLVIGHVDRRPTEGSRDRSNAGGGPWVR
jgi:hypothetical protein